MAATLLIPTALRSFTEGKSRLDAEGETAGALLRWLAETFPDIGPHLFEDDGRLRPYVNIFVGEEDIRFLDGLETPVAAGTEVAIVPAIAGGSGISDATGNSGGEKGSGDPADSGREKGSGDPAGSGPEKGSGDPAGSGPEKGSGDPADSGPERGSGDPADSGPERGSGNPADSGRERGSGDPADSGPERGSGDPAGSGRGEIANASGKVSPCDLIGEDRLADLSREELVRYGRHLILPEIGLEGQKRLKAARVLIVGTGGLGAPLALYLAAAGVGTLGLVDFDFVEASNLQRQIIHSTADIDRPKTASARDRILGINPGVHVEVHNTALTSKNALRILKNYDVVADGTDNYPTRYLVNDACVLLGIPNVYGSVFRYEGQASVFFAGRGPCYRCLYPAPPPPGLVPSCAEGGVMGVLPGIVGSLQASEVIKLIVGGGETLTGRLLLFDAWSARFRELKLKRDPACPICGAHPVIKELIDYDSFCGLGQQEEDPADFITATELKARIDRGDPLQIIDIREPHEQAIAKFPGARYIPLGQMSRRVDEFDPAVDAVFLCKIGQRSLFAIRALRKAGYEGRLFNLRDGVNAWAREADTAFPLY